MTAPEQIRVWLIIIHIVILAMVFFGLLMLIRDKFASANGLTNSMIAVTVSFIVSLSGAIIYLTGGLSGIRGDESHFAQYTFYGGIIWIAGSILIVVSAVYFVISLYKKINDGDSHG